MLLFAREAPFVIDGAPVLNGIAVVAKAAEMALSLKELTGVFVSRRSTYAKAPAAAISEFLAAAALARRQPQPAQLGDRLVGRAVMDGGHAGGAGAFDVGQHVVDEHGIAGLEAAASGRRDRRSPRRAWRSRPGPTRHSRGSRPRKGWRLLRRAAQPGIEKAGAFDSRYERRAGGVQASRPAPPSPERRGRTSRRNGRRRRAISVVLVGMLRPAGGVSPRPGRRRDPAPCQSRVVTSARNRSISPGSAISFR